MFLNCFKCSVALLTTMKNNTFLLESLNLLHGGVCRLVFFWVFFFKSLTFCLREKETWVKPNPVNDNMLFLVPELSYA